MRYFSSSVLYPTTSSLTDPTIRKANNSPDLQLSVSWTKSVFCGHGAHLWCWKAAAGLTQRPQRKAPNPQRTNSVPTTGTQTSSPCSPSPPLPPWTSLLSDPPWDPLVAPGSRRVLVGAWLLQHILQAGPGLGALPAAPGAAPAGTRGQAGEFPMPASPHLGSCLPVNSPPWILPPPPWWHLGNTRLWNPSSVICQRPR